MDRLADFSLQVVQRIPSEGHFGNQEFRARCAMDQNGAVRAPFAIGIAGPNDS